MEYNGLPNEVLERICYHLCFHCQNPSVFPNSDTKENRADKVALAHLCRSSKCLNAIAQPILFHYYAAGNLPRKVNTDLSRQFFGEENDRLHLFLRTLIARPDLGACIRALQLQTSNVPTNCTPETLELFAQASRALGVATATHLYPEPNKYRTLVTRHRRNIHRWLQALSIALAPRLEMLLHVLEDVTPYDFLKDASLKLPALKTVALRGTYSNYFLDDAWPLIAAAPNLDTLYALDCGDPVDDGIPSKLALGGVRKIVLGGIELIDLEKMLSCCHSLRHLELYLYDWPDNLLMMGAVAPVRASLRRLCLTRLPLLAKNYCDILPDDDNMVLPSLNSFRHLEILIIDQIFVYNRQNTQTNTGRLAELLPTNIQSLHLTYVHMNINADLLHLAATAPSNFPNLRNVKVGFIDVTPARAAEMEELLMVEAAFAESGVRLTWGEDFTGPYVYTTIPGGTPGMTIAHVNTTVPGGQPGTTVVHVPALADSDYNNYH